MYPGGHKRPTVTGTEDAGGKPGPPRPIKLRPHSYLVLGMVRMGASSGYAIKKATDLSTRYFWPTSLAQVYPELSRLEEAGLVSRRENPHGARARSAYQVTEEGEAALLAWLRSGYEAALQFRDEGVLRLYFADALPREEQLALIRRLRERAQGVAERLASEVLPLADAVAEGGIRHPALVARLGADTYAYVADWLEQREAELTALGEDA
jgi:DNA-binding PadR family transcriptional regulator